MKNKEARSYSYSETFSFSSSLKQKNKKKKRLKAGKFPYLVTISPEILWQNQDAKELRCKKNLHIIDSNYIYIVQKQAKLTHRIRKVEGEC